MWLLTANSAALLSPMIDDLVSPPDTDDPMAGMLDDWLLSGSPAVEAPIMLQLYSDEL